MPKNPTKASSAVCVATRPSKCKKSKNVSHCLFPLTRFSLLQAYQMFFHLGRKTVPMKALSNLCSWTPQRFRISHFASSLSLAFLSSFLPESLAYPIFTLITLSCRSDTKAYPAVPLIRRPPWSDCLVSNFTSLPSIKEEREGKGREQPGRVVNPALSVDLFY